MAGAIDDLKIHGESRGLKVLGASAELYGGATEYSVGVADDARGILYRVRQVDSSDGETLEVGAESYMINENTFKVISRYHNGALVVSMTDAELERDLRNGQSTCTGCTTPAPGNFETYLITECDAVNWQCALALAACAGCLASCRRFNPACLFCLVTSCYSAIIFGGCCDDQRTGCRLCYPYAG